MARAVGGRDLPLEAFKRIVVVGTAGCGKTTFASTLAERLAIPHIELDALHWEPGWQEASTEAFRLRVRAAVAEDAWVVDGNYSVARDLVWPRSELIVWLDYRLPMILARLVRRTARRIFTREELWSGNRERFWTQVATRESILLWALQTYRRRRRQTPVALSSPEHAHLTVCRFRSPREADQLLARPVD